MICKRCGYRYNRPESPTCRNCERKSWRKPLAALTTREMRGLDSRGFDTEGRFEPLAIRDANLRLKVRRKTLVDAKLRDLLGERKDEQ